MGKKMTALLLALLITALCGCTALPAETETKAISAGTETKATAGSETDGSEASETAATEETAETQKPKAVIPEPDPVLSGLTGIKIGDTDAALYKIVCGKNADASVKNAAKKLQDFLGSVLGTAPELLYDYTVGEEQAREIVIGRTNRSKSTADAVSEDDYWSKTVGNRLLLGGGSDTGTIAAVERFIRGSLGKVENGVYTVSAENIIFRSEERTDPVLHYLEVNAVNYRKEAGKELLVQYLTKRADTATDVYGGYSFATLCLPAGTLTAAQLKKANRIVRNTMAYSMEDGGCLSILTEDYKNTTVGHPFTAIRLVRLLYSDQSLLEKETKEQMKSYFLTANFCSKHDSENLILMFHTARYLAACRLTGETFVQYGLTAEEAKKEDRDFIVSYLQYRAAHGWAEFDSYWYNIEDFGFMLALYDLAQDEELRTLAEMTMDVFLLGMITDSTENNISGGAHGRVYASSAYSVEAGMSYLLSLYFGKEDSASQSDGVVIENSPFAFLSDYKPDSILYEIEEEKEYPFSSYDRTFNKSYDHTGDATAENNGYISKYTYNTETYSIGCINTQDYYPDGASKNYRYFQQTNWSLVFAENSYATVFTSHPGCAFEDKTLGQKASHDFWFGDGGCNCQEFFGNESTVIGIYNIDPSKQKYTYIHAHIEETLFDQIIWATEENAIYMKLGDAYAVLRFTSAYKRNKTMPEEVIVHRIGTGNARIGFVCEAGDKKTYGSFEAFVEAMRGKELVFDKENLSLSYNGLSLYATGSGKSLTWHRTLNGTEQTFPYANTYESPYMTSVYGSGVIEMKSPYSVRTLDFYHITDTKKER